MHFSGTSLLGKQGQICFAEYLKIVNKKQKGGFRRYLAPLAPSKLEALATSTPTTPTTPSVMCVSAGARSKDVSRGSEAGHKVDEAKY